MWSTTWCESAPDPQAPEPVGKRLRLGVEIGS